MLLGLLGLPLLSAACEESPVPTDDFPTIPALPGVDSGVPQGDGGSVPSGPVGQPQADGSVSVPVDGGSSPTPTDASTGSDAQTQDAASEKPLDKYGLEPFPTSGEPIDAPDDDTWTWVDFPDTKCRDGSTAGIAVRRNAASNDLMIFLEGGGACFDDVTCAANPANAAVWKSEQTGGILNREDPENPLKDWNLVYVPYCTGDVHAGTNTDVFVSLAFPKEQFVGYLNMQKYLQRVVPTFPDPERVLLTGISAGGYGASSTAVLVQRAYPNEKLMLIDDSGPPQSDEVVPPCLQQRMRELWGFDNSILKDCPACDPNNLLQDYGAYLVETFDDRPSGLIESVHDNVIAGFFGAGNNDCTGVALVTPVSPEVFETGLLEFRDIAKSSENFGTYFPSGSQHTYLTDLFDVKFTDAEVNGVKLTDWVSDIINGVGTSHVGP